MVDLIRIIIGSGFAFFTIAILAWVLLRWRDYRQMPLVAHKIVRWLASIGAGGAGGFFFGELTIQMNLPSGLAIEATAGFALFVVVYFHWGKTEKVAIESEVEKLLAEGHDRISVQRIAEKLTQRPEIGWFSHHVNADWLEKAVKAIAEDATSGNEAAAILLLKLETNPTLEPIIAYFRDLKSKHDIRAALLHIGAEHAESNAALEIVLAEMPDDPEMLMFQASNDEHLGNDERAKRTLVRLISNLNGTKIASELKLLGDARSFLAHLVEVTDPDHALTLRKQAYDDYRAIGDTSRQVFTAISMNDRERLEALEPFVDNDHVRALLLRNKAWLDLESDDPVLRDRALAGFQAALKIDIASENKEGLYSSYQGLAKVYQQSNDLERAEENARKSIDSARAAGCWKAERGSTLILADVMRSRGQISEMAALMRQAADLSMSVGDHDAQKIILAFESNSKFLEISKLFGILDENDKIVDEPATYAFEMLEKHGPEKLHDYMVAYNIREDILAGMLGNSNQLGLVEEEAQKLFEELGFTAQMEDVDIEKAKAFYTRLKQEFSRTSVEENSLMARLRHETLKKMAHAEELADALWYRAVVIRLGFSFDDPFARDLSKFRRESARIVTGMGSDIDPVAEALRVWSHCMASLVSDDSTEEEKKQAVMTMNLIGADEDPNSVTEDGALKLREFIAQAEMAR